MTYSSETIGIIKIYSNSPLMKSSDHINAYLCTKCFYLIVNCYVNNYSYFIIVLKFHPDPVGRYPAFILVFTLSFFAEATLSNSLQITYAPFRNLGLFLFSKTFCQLEIWNILAGNWKP